ncbi:MAG: hypothetical protein VYE22_11045 [Myxococcota bacterium]|nr:hypothetical protein [Myxococcota bacterium]
MAARLTLLLLAAAALTGCPGSIEDPARFRAAAAGACPPSFDVEQDLFARTCGTLGCHTGGPTLAAAGLDLTTAGVGGRLLEQTSVECDGRPMIHPTDLGQSYLLDKLGEDPACGDPMPQGLPPLNGTERACLEQYLADLSGLEVPSDAGVMPAGDAGDEPPPDGGVGPAPETVTLQAEAMTLNGYVVDTADATLIRLPDGTTSGTATATFEGAAGSYALRLHGVTESDGAPRVTVRVAGEVVLEETYPLAAEGLEPRAFGPVDVALSPGDTIVIEGAAEANAWARVDRLELTP